MATIKQIASLAGVSRGTVDRVLNGRGGVSPATAAKVKEIASAMNYTPNKAGKTLAVLKKNLRIGFIIFNATSGNPFFADVIAGIQAKQAEIQEFGIGVDTFFTGLNDHHHQVSLMDNLMEQGYSAIAITPVNHPKVAKKIQELMENNVPVITVNTDIGHSGRLAYVGSDYYRSGKTAAGLMGLITGGNAKVGVVIGSLNVLCHTERVSGFKRHIQKYQPGIQIVGMCENHDDDYESFSVTKELMQKHPEIDALYLAAAGVYGAGRAVKAMGLQDKLRIISVDAVPSTVKMMKNGIISATICQQPFIQGTKPLDILTEYLAFGIQPSQDSFYTDIDIRIRENL